MAFRQQRNMGARPHICLVERSDFAESDRANGATCKMSVVYLPRCHMCGWTMRLVRVCERGRIRLRVLQCTRCHAELMWTPGLHDDPANKFLAAVFPPKAEEPGL
jgi:hypothetical protein